MRALIVLLALSTLLAAPAASSGQAPPQAAAGDAVFVLEGRGWGHGVGMSQYGAYGMAKAGRTYEEILTHYYTGVTLGRAGRKEVRVLLGEGRRAVTISSTGPITATDGTSSAAKLGQGPFVLRADLRLPGGNGAPTPATSPLVLRTTKSAALSVDGKPYRGKIELASQGGLLRVVNTVPVEAYLQGVVAGEMPYTWPLEALKAQAVAARSYALASLVKGKPFDLYSDVRSQVYLGVSGEKASTNQAIRATAGQVVLSEGRIATTFYFSTSGGRTASAADVFGVPTPHLVSRPDPWDKASPYHRWGPVVLSARALQSQLGLDARVLDVKGVPTPSGRLRSLVVDTPAGAKTVPAALLRSGLGLRSTWVTIGVLRLDRPTGAVTYGSSLRLTGIARGVASPTVQASPNGSAWGTVGEPTVEGGGVATLAVRPLKTIRYRLQADGATSPALLVRVAPRVVLERVADTGMLEGTVKPRLTAAVVTVERRRRSVRRLVRRTMGRLRKRRRARAPARQRPTTRRARRL